MQNIILRCVVGSQSYGLATPDSDVDVLELFLTPTCQLVGLRPPADCHVSHTEQGDVTQWELGKFCRLALQGNPTALELLWTPSDHIQEQTAVGGELRDLRAAFTSKAAYPRYRGFCWSQYQRMLKDGRSSHGHHIPAGQSYDYKAASHCLRLLAQGTRLLEGGALDVPLNTYEQYDFIRFVKKGSVGLTTVLNRITDGLASMEAALVLSTLPEEPDQERVNAWLVGVRRQHWGEDRV